jgi:hypothetical protein
LIDRGFYNYSVPALEKEDVVEVSDRLARYEIAVLGMGVEKVFLYSVNNGGEWHAGAGAFGTLVTDDAYVHPCGAAHSAMAWELEDTRFVKRVEAAKGVYGYIFSGANRTVVAITGAAHYERFVPPALSDMAVRDLFGNDVGGGQSFEGRVMYLDTTHPAAEVEAALLSPEPH